MSTPFPVPQDGVARMLERAASIGVWRLDIAGRTLEWSAQLASIHGAPPGYKPDEPLAHYTPESRAKVQPLLDACIADGTPFDEPAQILQLDGRRSWVRSLAEPVRDEGGAIVAVQGAVQEIAPAGARAATRLRMGAALASGDAFVTLDPNGQYTFLNEQAQRLLGADTQQLLGRRFWSSFQKTVRLRLEEQFRAACEKGTRLEFEELDARLAHWFEVRAFPFAGGMAAHLRDVTSRRKAQEQLRLLEGSISRLNDIVIITEAGPFSEPGPRIVFVNEAFERRTGYSRDEVVGRSPRFLQGPNTQRRALDQIRAALEEWRPARVDVINYNKNGEPYWVDLDVSPVWDKQRKLTHWVAVGRDVTERKLAEEKIQHLAFYDALTKLPNRQLLMDRLHAALSDPGRPQLVAERLRSCVAKGDTVARLGGDEFVILLENRGDKPLEPAKGAHAVAERILAALGEPYLLPGYMHHSTCSIGVTLFGQTDRTVSELLKQADLAMYQAKGAGRNTVCFFDPEMQALASANAALASDLRQAWRETQFHVDYQPQVGPDGRMIGVEALLRWKHPQRGMVPPEQFITAAEETSLIIPIGRWVLDQACAQLAEWERRQDRRHLTVAVNVSVRQFRHPEFVDEVMDAIGQSGIQPHKLKLELTESLLADGIDVTIAKMGSLKAMGVTLSLDDFGIGYSSLSYLKRLPLDQLKIDREFVKDILTDANDAAIAKTVINLAHSLDLDVIAEGVETEEQREFLARQGCHAYQGYLFCRPLPIEELEAFMSRLPAEAPA
jgi:PAS domain S-box-containing protein